MISEKSIAVIDDSDDYLSFIKASLKKIAGDIPVVTFIDIDTAKKDMEQEPADLVLCDINFDTGNDTDRQGLDFLAWYRLKYPQNPIFMMTRYLDQGFKEEALKLGATGFLEKPIRIDQIKSIINDHL